MLTDISFTTRAGQTTAIVGSTGAGKTTLLQLIPRLFDATAGTVLVDGVDVRALDTAVLWSAIGLVPQRPYLFSGTIASNLAYGKPDATEAEMWEALEIAQAADFVRRMPGRLEARIEQGGTNVSGGQRQRLAIARALVGRPEIYLFDDSFSALDLATDARLRAALKPYTADSAVLIVAQRVSTITSADHIVVLEDGELVGQGTDARASAHLPDLRRDRAVPARPAGGRVTSVEDRGSAEHLPEAKPLPPSETRAAGRFNAAGVPTERSKDFSTAIRRLGRLMGPDRFRLALIFVLSVASATLNVFGPRVLGHGTDIIITGVDHGGINFGEAARCPHRGGRPLRRARPS